MSTPHIVIVHKDHLIDLEGVNGGAETATLALASALSDLGIRVTLAAPLRGKSQTKFEVYDLSPCYNTPELLAYVSNTGPYHLISTGRAQALIESLSDENCLSRNIILHEQVSDSIGVSVQTLSSTLDQGFFVSNAQLDGYLKKGFNKSKAKILTNGVNQNIFYSDEERLPSKRLVFSGALVHDKGIHVLLEAFNELKKIHTDASLDIFGTGGLWGREEIFDTAELQKSIPGIIFHGNQPQTVIAEHYRKAALSIVPSIWFDCFPLSSAESQACGCPVVCFDVGGLPETIINGETGIVCPEVSAESLFNTLNKLLSSPETLGGLSLNASEYGKQRFSWVKTAISLLTYLKIEVPGKALIPNIQPVSSRSGVSVAIITCNRLNYLREALESILNQEQEATEIVIIDDGSTDGTKDYLQSLNLEQVKTLAFDRNLGRPFARNKAVENCKGEYILWLDDDDVFTPDAVKISANFVENSGSEIACCSHISCDDLMNEKSKDFIAPIPQELLLHRFVFENPIRNGGTLVRRSVYETIGGYNNSYPRAQDYEFYARAAARGIRFGWTEAFTYKFRNHPNNLSNPTVIKDQSALQCRVLRGLLEETTIEQLFPQLEWSEKKFEESFCEALCALGKVFFDHGDNEASIDCYQRAWDISQRTVVSLYKGFSERAAGLHSRASESFANAIVKLEPALAPFDVKPGALRGSAKVAAEHESKS